MISRIYRAAHDGSLEMVLRLIDQDPRLVNGTNWDGYTSLERACMGGHVSVVAALVDHGANINCQGSNGHTAMYMACYEGHVPVVELMLEKRANPTLPTNHGVTPLMTASFNGHEGVAARLLHHPLVLSTINHCDSQGKTALYLACWRGHSEVVKVLLEAGADPTIRSDGGKTAMDIATERGKQECISLLKAREEHEEQ